jgi:hypothetical protein
MKIRVRDINYNRDIKLLSAIYHLFLVMPEYNEYKLFYFMLINVSSLCTAVLCYLQSFLSKYDTLSAFLLSFTLSTQSFYVILEMGGLALLVFV